MRKVGLWCCCMGASCLMVESTAVKVPYRLSDVTERATGGVDAHMGAQIISLIPQASIARRTGCSQKHPRVVVVLDHQGVLMLADQEDVVESCSQPGRELHNKIYCVNA
jgi:hypothetical protein